MGSKKTYKTTQYTICVMTGQCILKLIGTSRWIFEYRKRLFCWNQNQNSTAMFYIATAKIILIKIYCM